MRMVGLRGVGLGYTRSVTSILVGNPLRAGGLGASRLFSSSWISSTDRKPVTPTEKLNIRKVLDSREQIWTLPNILTMTRFAAAPVIGYLIVKGQTEWALGLFTYSCVTDFLDGWIARRFNKGSALGSILDPAADKALMFSLTTCLTAAGQVPLWIGGLILARDVGLGLSAFYIRYLSLPPPKTFKRYWDMSIPSVQVFPSTVSKVNTVLQMFYLGLSLAQPVIPSIPIELTQYMGYIVATTTFWSGMDYLLSKNSVKFIKS